ncbi:MAG: response regulator [bacterium]|nr:response regulator [bacterium]
MYDYPSRDKLLREVRALRELVEQLQDQAASTEPRPPEAVAAGDAAGPPGRDIESLGRYASSIAHDLNNLLVGILGNAGLALMDLSTYSPCRPLIKEVDEAAQRAAVLVNQMLSLAPREEPAEAPPVSAPAAEIAPRGPAWRGEGLMLVVDDEQMVRSLAKRILEKFGFQVMTAEDGQQAVEIFRHHADEFVAVLLDVTMPNLDGAETFGELRRLRPDIKVILSSGYVEGEAMKGITREDLAGFLHKPYMPMQLIDMLREALER